MHVNNKEQQATCRLSVWKFWWIAKTSWDLQAKRRKTNERETETNKKKRGKFQWTVEMVECLLDLLKRYKVICDFSGKDFDADKTVQ